MSIREVIYCVTSIMWDRLLSWEPLVLTKENDFLWSLEKVEFLKEFIETELEEGWLLTKENDRMIALYGWRGTGKSSVMQTLCESNYYWLDKSKCKTLFFEAWKYEKDGDLILSLFTFLLVQLNHGRSRIDIIKEKWESAFIILKNLTRWFSVNVSASDLDQRVSWWIAYDADKVISWIEKDFKSKKGSPNSYYLETEQLKWNFEKLLWNEKLVIFIDDLDRCASENIINLLSAIKLFFTYIPNAVFVVWIDKSAVTLALKRMYGDDEDKAEEYLEKVFTVNFSLSSNYDIYDLVQRSLSSFSDFHCQSVCNMFERIHFKNPRHIKKILNKINLVNKFINKERFDIENDKIIFSIFVYYCYLYEFDFNLFNEIDINVHESWRNTNYYLKIMTTDRKNIHWPTHIGAGSNHLLVLRFFLPFIFENKEVVWLHDINWSDTINHIVQSTLKLSFMLWKSSDFLLFLLDLMKGISLKELQNYDKLCPQLLHEVKRIF